MRNFSFLHVLKSCVHLAQGLAYCGQLLGYGVGDVDLIDLGRIIDLNSLAANHARRYADCCAVGRNFAQHNGVCRNSAVISDLKGSEHLCACSDKNVIPDRRMAFSAVLARTAEGNAVIYKAVVADLGGFADNYAHAVVDDEAAAYLCAGVDLYTRSVAADLRDHTREKQQVMLIAPMRAAMIEHGLHTGIQKQNLKRPFCRRVAIKSLESASTSARRFVKFLKNHYGVLEAN